VDRAAAFDHEPVDAPAAEVFAQAAHVDPRSSVHDGRDSSEPATGVVGRRAGAVHELLDVACDEEVRLCVELSTVGDGDLRR
jgi:hypothetical protein